MAQSYSRVGRVTRFADRIIVDCGLENFDGGVDQLIAEGIVRRVLAQVEIGFSNSMVEAF